MVSRKKLNALGLQNWKCADCGMKFTEKSLEGKHWKDKGYPHFDHKNTRTKNTPRPRWPSVDRSMTHRQNKIRCTECHAKRHDYKWGWMKKFKKVDR